MVLIFFWIPIIGIGSAVFTLQNRAGWVTVRNNFVSAS